jgi:hypothetical protein
MLDRIVDGRTDLVFEHMAKGHPVAAIASGHPLIRWCAYYGDVSAIRFLIASGESLTSLGDNFDLNGACFHGHWRLLRIPNRERSRRQSSFGGDRRNATSRRSL